MLAVSIKICTFAPAKVPIALAVRLSKHWKRATYSSERGGQDRFFLRVL